MPDAPCYVHLEERKPILGEKHQDTNWATKTLANTLGEMDQLDEAVSSLEVTGEKMRLQVLLYNDI